jgi:flagellar hook-associated protein 1 FlgK
MNIGLRAMFASQAAITTAGNNIANASVDGYSRQSVELKTAPGQYTGAGFFGKGVDVATVSRAYNEFLNKEAVSTKSLASMDSARLDMLNQLQNVFPIGEDGVGYSMSELLNSMSDLASRPTDLPTRQVTLARAQDVATRFNQAGQQLDQIQAAVSTDLSNSVTAINGLAKRLGVVNGQIAASAGTGHTPNDLLDERDRLVSQIAGYMKVSTLQADDGSVSVFVAGGQRLVLGNQAQQLAVIPDPHDGQRMQAAIVDGSQKRALDWQQIGGGSLSGLLQFQNVDLVDATNKLGQLAASLSTAVNQQQALGLDMKVPPGAGAALFTTPLGRALPGSSNTGTASVSITLSDPTLTAASDYMLTMPDPTMPDTYQLVKQPGGQTLPSFTVDPVTRQATVEGMTITVSPGMAMNDSFLLQPFGRTAANIGVTLSDPRGLAAAAPVSGAAGLANTGTATVASVQVTSTAIDPTLTANFAFTSPTGYSWELRDASNAVVATGTGTWSAGQPLTASTPLVDRGFQMVLNGVPKTNDTFTVAGTDRIPNAVGAGNTGVTAIARATAVGGSSDLSLNAQVTFTGASTYTYNLVDAAGRVSSSGSGTLGAGQPLVLNGVALTLTGTPAAGDTLEFSRSTFTPGNNGNAVALANLRDAQLVDRTLSAGVASGGTTLAEGYATALADVGVRVQGATSAHTTSSALAASAQAALSSETGVNLDEEAAKLMQFQQSYQAAAKVLQIAQTLFDSVLQAAGGG